MTRKRLQLVACWLTVFATLVNAAVASAGLVRCNGPGGEIILEAGCHHDHCDVEAQFSDSPVHVHDADAGCANVDCCSCEDTQIGEDIATAARRVVDLWSAPTPTLSLVGWIEPTAIRGPGKSAWGAVKARPQAGETLRALRTVILLI